MASAQQLVQEVADEFGLLEDKYTILLNNAVNEATLVVLSQGDGRFPELLQTQSFTGDGVITEVALNQNFRSPRFLAPLNDSSEPSDFYGIVDLAEIVERRRLSKTVVNFCYIDNVANDADRFKLVFPIALANTVIFRFDYFRFALKADVTLIHNEEMVKSYMRSRLDFEVNPGRRGDANTFSKMRDDYGSRQIELITQRLTKPRWIVQDHNELLNVIGREL